MLPRAIKDLSEVAEEYHDGYIPAEDGFTLHPELSSLLDQQDAELAEADAKTQRTEAAVIASMAEREISDALRAAGVSACYVPGVTALIRQKMNFRLEEGDAGFRLAVADAYGEVGIEFAVNTWLATEEADPFRPAPKVGDGPLMARLRELRAAMQ